MVEWIMTYWLEAIFLMLFGYVTRIIKSQKSLKLGVQALLQDRLAQSIKYHLEQGYCTMQDRYIVMNMYQQYHNLGANGVMDDYMKDFLALKTIKANDSIFQSES